GVAVRLVTDAPCAPVVAAALQAAELGDACPLDVVAVEGFEGGEPLDLVEARLRSFGPSHVVAIERCGPSADGRPRNARGEDVGAWTAPLERLFALGAITIGIGDGGNELGMGSLPLPVIAGAIAHGEVSACRTPADVLVVAGVSNWAGVALALLLGCEVDGATHDRLLAAITAAGAVDGITRAANGTVDGVAAEAHRALADQLLALVRSERPA
ncbi:MAG: glutamate cyclase domain-containing protein, partial [Pseudomonadota bacterium]